jgi:tetratricopeptide (TPR) repeat protein
MEAALQLPGSEQHPAVAAELLSGMARLQSFSGDMAGAHDLAARSIALWRGLVQPRGLAFALFHQGVPALFVQGLDAARAALREARDCFRQVDDVWGVALSTVYEGVVLALRPGQDDEALAVLNEGLARAQALGDEWAASTCSGYIGSVALRRGDLATARRGFTHILSLARATGDRFRMARSTHLLSELELAEGRYAQALTLLREALSLALEQGRAADQPQLLRGMARALAGLHRHAEAAALWGAAQDDPNSRPTLPPEDRAAVAAARDACRAALGEAEFERLAAAAARGSATDAAAQAQAWAEALGAPAEA